MVTQTFICIYLYVSVSLWHIFPNNKWFDGAWLRTRKLAGYLMSVNCVNYGLDIFTEFYGVLDTVTWAKAGHALKLHWAAVHGSENLFFLFSVLSFRCCPWCWYCEVQILQVIFRVLVLSSWIVMQNNYRHRCYVNE